MTRYEHGKPVISLWVHELDMFIYLILAILQALDNRFKKHNTIQQYVLHNLLM